MAVFELIVSAVLGLLLGSFSSALAYRMPRNIDWCSKRSSCTACGHVLSARDLIPVFSWLFSGGKCRHCGVGISSRYPLLEFTAALMCAAAVWKFGFGTPLFILIVTAVPILLALFLIDLEHMILPNRLIMMLVILGLGRLGVLLNQGQDFGVVADAILSAFIFAFSSWFLGWSTSKILKKDALGMGDVKFFFAAGLWLNVILLPYFMLLSGVFGIALAIIWRHLKGDGLFPFGPALILSFYILLYF